MAHLPARMGPGAATEAAGEFCWPVARRRRTCCTGLPAAAGETSTPCGTVSRYSTNCVSLLRLHGVCMSLRAGGFVGVRNLQAIPISDYGELCAAVRARMAEVDIAFETLDFLAGTQVGYAAKILGPTPSRRFGPVSWSILEALGLRVVVEVDPEAVERMRDRWTPREVPPRTSNGTDAAAGEAVYSG